MSYFVNTPGDQVGSFQVCVSEISSLLGWIAGDLRAPILKVAQASCLFRDNEVTGWKPILPFVGARRSPATLKHIGTRHEEVYSEKGDNR